MYRHAFVIAPPLMKSEASRHEILPFAPRVLVGVDHIPSEYLSVGSTQSLEVVVSQHRPGDACAGCLHPEEPPDRDATVATISFVSFWAGLLQALYLISETLAVEPAGQVVTCWPFGWDGVTLLWHPLAPQARCPVSCDASRAIARAS